MIYNSFDQIFDNYRKKKVFEEFSSDMLKQYIHSITEDTGGVIRIYYPNDWEAMIYQEGISDDMSIWKNIKDLSPECHIIRGQKTDVFLSQAAKLISKKNKAIIIHNVEGGGHLFPFERPDKTISYLNEII